MSLRSALGWGLVFVLVQILFTALFSGAHSPQEAYFKLLNWDSFHYRSIAEKGYSYPASGKVSSDDIHAGLANVVFFPGYPAAAGLLHRATGISVELALLVVAHL